MDGKAVAALAAAIVEAFETGNPIAPLDPDFRPPDAMAAEAVAEAVVDALGIPPCGLRLLLEPDGSWIAGPMLPPRLLPDGATIALAALRHPRISAAAVGVLAEALEPDTETPPGFSAVRPALDIAASRYRDGAATAPEAIADLAGLGFVIAGRGAAMPAGPVAAACAPAPKRPRGREVDLARAFATAAEAARRLGGLPAGALLVIAGLTPPAEPAAGEKWAARLRGLGRARAAFEG